MRRGLLTVGGPPPAVPLDVGFDFTSASSSGTVYAARIHWGGANPLNAAGTITSVQAHLGSGSASAVAFFLISPSNEIRSISDDLTPVYGVSTYSVNLTGEPGDYIGVWGNANFYPTYTTTSGITHRDSYTAAKPAPGDTRNPGRSTNNRAVWLYGTG